LVKNIKQRRKAIRTEKLNCVVKQNKSTLKNLFFRGNQTNLS